MTFQQAIVPLIEDAYKNLFANADPLADKLDYKASETTRTPLELVVECVTAPAMLTKIMREGKMPENMGEGEEAKVSLTDIPACRAHFEAIKGDLFDAVRTFPEEKLGEMVETPWGTFPWYDFISYLYWNPMWHAGQLSYIQTIHGDTAMYFG